MYQILRYNIWQRLIIYKPEAPRQYIVQVNVLEVVENKRYKSKVRIDIMSSANNWRNRVEKFFFLRSTVWFITMTENQKKMQLELLMEKLRHKTSHLNLTDSAKTFRMTILVKKKQTK